MNKAILIGNLTRDPETRTTSSGINVTTFGIAVNRRMANAQGVREADFFNIVAWRQLGDTCARFLKKGSKVSVIGQIQNRTYDAQDGSKRYITEIIADDVEFLPSGNGNGYANSGRGGSVDDMPVPPENGMGSGNFTNNVMTETGDDDLPF